MIETNHKMDALELLAREDEFKRLNKQLQKKTDSLMKEIEHVMVRNFSSNSLSCNVFMFYIPNYLFIYLLCFNRSNVVKCGLLVIA